ncbi:MAG: hypothetical protein ABIG37_01665 [Nanoarchaeota archaeon]
MIKKQVKKFEKNWIIISLVIALLFLLCILTKFYGVSDVGDYSDIAKFFAGKYSAKLRTSHPISYGLMHTPFLKIMDSFIFLKLSSVLWLSLIIISVYYISNKNKKTLLLILTTPVIWYMSPYISPIPLTCFLFLWSYYFIKKYDEKQELKHLLYSGLLIGVAWIFWEAVTYFAFALVITFLLNKKLSHSIYFVLALLVGVFPKLLIDYIFFGFPFYSILKHFFSVIAFSFYGSIYGQTENRSLLALLPTLLIIPIYTLILFTKRNFKKYKKQIFFILFSLFMIWLAGSQIRYVFMLIPIIILLLGEILTEKQFKIQLIIFIVLTLLIANLYLIQAKYETNSKDFSQFVINLGSLELNSSFYESTLNEDIIAIAKDYPAQIFIVGNSPDDYQTLAHVYWEKNIKEFVSIQDYRLFLQDSSLIFKKTICSNSKIQNRREICISAYLERLSDNKDNTDYSSIKYAISLQDNLDLDNFKLIKKYHILSLFEKV